MRPTLISLTHITTVYSGCRSGFPVQWAAFDGDHTPSPVDGSGSPNDASTWTSGEIWRFFAQFENTPSPTTTAPTSSTPTTSAPTGTSTRTAPSTTPPGGQTGTCAAVYRTVNAWPGGYQAEFTVTNNAATTLIGWTVGFTLASGQTISSLWNGTNSGTSGNVSVKNAACNGSLGAGASTTFGFTASGNNTNPPGNVTCASP
jgi:hypothetical protein